MGRTYVLNPRTGKFDLVNDLSELKFAESVATVADLPASGDEEGTIRQVVADGHLYQIQNDVWVDIGTFVESHDPNHDLYLDFGGANQVSAVDLKEAVEKMHDEVTAGDGINIDSSKEIVNIDKGTTARSAHELAFNHSQLHAPNGDTLVNLPVNHELIVDNSRVDSYVEDGTVGKPFKTIQSALNALTGTRNTIKVLAGVYTETLTLSYNDYLLIDLVGAHIIGNFTWNVNSTTTYKPKLVIRGIDLRSTYPATSAYHLNGIQGNVNIVQDVSISRYTALHLINTGVVGNINISNTATNVLTHVFMSNAVYTGDIITTNSTVYLYADASNRSSSASIGGAVGAVLPYQLNNVEITRAWTINATISGGGGGAWYNVVWKSGSNFTNLVGNYKVDANSYASYYANVGTKGAETFTFRDEDRGVKNNSTADGTTVKDALDHLDANKSETTHNHTGTYEPANSNIQSHIGITDGNPHGTDKTDVGLGNVQNILNKYNATSAPTTGDDSGDGYSVGSHWIDITADKEYVCVDNTLGTAIWVETTAVGGTGGSGTGSGGGVPGGSDGDVQFNSADTLGGNSTFHWNDLEKILTLIGNNPKVYLRNTGNDIGIALDRRATETKFTIKNMNEAVIPHALAIATNTAYARSDIGGINLSLDWHLGGFAFFYSASNWATLADGNLVNLYYDTWNYYSIGIFSGVLTARIGHRGYTAEATYDITSLSDGYHMLGLKWDYTGNTISLVVDNIVKDTSPYSIEPIEYPITEITVGNKGSNGCIGKYDELALWSGVSATAKFTTLWNNGLGKRVNPATDLDVIGLWHFDEDIGSTVALDDKGDNDLTLNGSVSFDGDYKVEYTDFTPVVFVTITDDGKVVLKGSKTVQIDSALSYAMRLTETSGELTDLDHTIIADATSGAVAMTLPAISGYTKGREYVIIKKDSSSNPVSVSAVSGETIQGTTSIDGQNESLTVRCIDETTWLAVSGNGVGGAGSTPAGNDKEVQFNDSSAMGADSGFTFDKTTKTLTITDANLARLILKDSTNNIQFSFQNKKGQSIIGLREIVAGEFALQGDGTNSGVSADFSSTDISNGTIKFSMSRNNWADNIAPQQIVFGVYAPDPEQYNLRVYLNGTDLVIKKRCRPGEITHTYSLAGLMTGKHRFIIAIDTANLYLYVDGNLVLQEATASPWCAFSFAYIFAEDSGYTLGADHSDVLIDEIAILSAKYTLSQVRADWNNGSVPRGSSSEPNLVALWHLDEGTGLTAHDSSANDKDITLTASTMWSDSALVTEGTPDINIVVAQVDGTVQVSGYPLKINGAVNHTVLGVDSDYTLNNTMHTIYVDATNNTVALTLPDASEAMVGREYIIYKKDSTANAVSIVASSGDTINGTDNVTSQFACILVKCLEVGSWISKILS